MSVGVLVRCAAVSVLVRVFHVLMIVLGVLVYMHIGFMAVLVAVYVSGHTARSLFEV